MNKQTIKLAEPDSCTGCAVCADSCPTSSIEMSSEGKLFSFPSINADTCIFCGKCMRVCPSLNSLEPQNYNQRFFAAWNKDIVERKASTSGGVGTALSRSAISKGYKVYGVSFDGDWKVRHSMADDEKSLDAFRGSKYVQSDTTGVYTSALKRLRAGDKVLFIGTPCQVEAIKRFTPNELTQQLITCEIICHGVNSPKVWSDYVKYLQKTHNSDLENYVFRSKSHGWQNLRGGGFCEWRINSHQEQVWMSHLGRISSIIGSAYII